ncbi:hypothetical protein RhiirA1_415827 [Rhizophagus irregularis]|nr:hypothetical protein GLOIN_2v1564861 [Rhizophagus irregularis DAOM 181602=DAOM 197198]PKC69284.1 hypothetical protein RhiirA1_415827 [Rhizophagus irregularis]PKK73413.1 hypothetical protein RhiirC2_740829 [Rhizophagus irregularis]PKY13164.1 hypothetical protein RhiirB3_398495 [Rhizophagus irregularis]PKY37592.1 hypothetical protein RhiirA4_390649 [Rhizophagus irregularis]POG75446.1 hypothetical protein GLOIN_2v1564861 [Rhizophagus irregularis DAOM 181602=DAOM 197198]|eukprot:XP_025182312.1 hypothetical protein GLOIN_2v1564861 [Rhizophagus irregularis DAOM 181602=DAOM 197198]
MAKGMRSKIKRRFRAIKRQTVFAPVETARTQRLAAKQTQTEQQTNSLNSQEQSLLQHKTEVFTFSPTTDLTSDMIIDTDAPKISTSGPRNSRHQQWKRKKLSRKKKRNSLIHF